MMQIPLLSHEEIARKLRAMGKGRGRPKKGATQSLAAVQVFCKIKQKRRITDIMTGRASRPGNAMSRSEHIRLSAFFHRYDKGEISFYYNGKEWEILFHRPKPAEKKMERRLIMTINGPKFDWVEV